jgi:nicotinamide phosphoribosyltransferase
MFGITNTHDDFAWLPQALESLISAEMWYPQITATVGKTYRDIVNKYYSETCDSSLKETKALSNFDFRGDMNLEAALTAASGWLLSFENTSTVPVIKYLERYYDADPANVGRGAISTEHFTVCSNYAVDGDERTFLKRLLTEIYPNNSFSCVCDSYDYWNVVDNIIPSLKNEILEHNGTFLVRGDSGDCAEVVTKTVFKLWEIFGGTYNSKGYKVLDPHVKALYGDSIQIETAERIYTILEDAGFAASNVSLGVGSFSMHCIIENGQFKPFTRDTFSSAIKACNATINGVEMAIYKDPKTDRETGAGFKKSQKGCSRVFMKDGVMTYQDELTYEESLKDTLMIKVFEDGVLVEDQKLSDIRARLNNNNF